jgi:integrase
MVRAPPPEPICAGRPWRLVCVGASLYTSLRHTHAVEMAREGVPLVVIQRQPGHSNLGLTPSTARHRNAGSSRPSTHAARR